MTGAPLVPPPLSPGRMLASFLWALAPAVSLGLLTPAVFAIAWIRLRTFGAFFGFGLYSGLLLWAFVANGEQQTNLPIVVHILVTWILGTVHASVVRKRVFRSVPRDFTDEPSRGRVAWSVVWALSPLLSLGILTVVTFIVACFRRRKPPEFLSAAFYLSVLVWSFATNGTPQEEFASDATLLTLWLFATVHAFVIRPRIWYAAATPQQQPVSVPPPVPEQRMFERPVLRFDPIPTPAVNPHAATPYGPPEPPFQTAAPTMDLHPRQDEFANLVNNFASALLSAVNDSEPSSSAKEAFDLMAGSRSAYGYDAVVVRDARAALGLVSWLSGEEIDDVGVFEGSNRRERERTWLKVSITQLQVADVRRHARLEEAYKAIVDAVESRNAESVASKPAPSLDQDQGNRQDEFGDLSNVHASAVEAEPEPEAMKPAAGLSAPAPVGTTPQQEFDSRIEAFAEALLGDVNTRDQALKVEAAFRRITGHMQWVAYGSDRISAAKLALESVQCLVGVNRAGEAVSEYKIQKWIKSDALIQELRDAADTGDPRLSEAFHSVAQAILRRRQAQTAADAAFNALLDTFSAAMRDAVGDPARIGKAEEDFGRLAEHPSWKSYGEARTQAAGAALQLAAWLGGGNLPADAEQPIDVLDRLQAADTADNPNLQRVYTSIVYRVQDRLFAESRAIAEPARPMVVAPPIEFVPPKQTKEAPPWLIGTPAELESGEAVVVDLEETTVPEAAEPDSAVVVSTPAEEQSSLSPTEPVAADNSAADAALPTAVAVLAKETLGQRVCATETYSSLVRGIPRAPSSQHVAAVIDAASAAGGRLSAAEVGRITGRPVFSIDGYISLLQRALNLDGTQVLSKQDDGTSIRLDIELLSQQFLGGSR